MAEKNDGNKPGIFADALKLHRDRLGLTQTQLGTLLPDPAGTPTGRATVAQWESGRFEPPGYAQKLILRMLKATMPRK